jgi:hypothetical protein
MHGVDQADREECWDLPSGVESSLVSHLSVYSYTTTAAKQRWTTGVFEGVGVLVGRYVLHSHVPQKTLTDTSLR